MRMEEGGKGGLNVEGAMGIALKEFSSVLSLSCMDCAKYMLEELARTAIACALFVKYSASCVGTRGLIGTGAALSASTASIATVYS